MDLASYSDAELLAELVRRNGHAPAPIKSHRLTPHREVIVGIGRDHVANIVMDDEALRLLERPLAQA